MSSVTGLTLKEAQDFCARLDRVQGIPPEGLPGIGGPGRTMHVSAPILMADGTYSVPVPDKVLTGPLEALLGALKAEASFSVTTSRPPQGRARHVRIALLRVRPFGGSVEGA